MAAILSILALAVASETRADSRPAERPSLETIQKILAVRGVGFAAGNLRRGFIDYDTYWSSLVVIEVTFSFDEKSVKRVTGLKIRYCPSFALLLNGGLSWAS
jgi:hypothetical protein